MTIRGHLLTWFPAIQSGAVLWALVEAIRFPSLGAFAIVLAVVYGLPLGLFRLHQRIAPLKPKFERLDSGYSIWWAVHQLQVFYLYFPVFERILRLIPGAFSLWLRLWGSSIGKGIYWTPSVEVLDRSLLDIGDYVVFGQNTMLSSHAIRPGRKGEPLLYVRRSKVAARAFVSADCVIGPGAAVEEGEFLEFAAHRYAFAGSRDARDSRDARTTKAARS